MNICDYAGQVIRKYGIQGDNSFEYVGVNIRQESQAQLKLYQKTSPKITAALRNTMPYCCILENLLPDFTNYKGIKICDFSRSTFDGEDSYRIVFSMPQQLKVQELNQYLSSFFKNVNFSSTKELLEDNIDLVCKSLCINESPLMQIGLETGQNGRVLCIKYYLRLRFNTVGPMNFTPNTAKLVSTISNHTCDENIVLRRVEFLKAHGFNPIFVGVNTFGKFQETKLYFISDAFGFQTKNVINHTAAIASEYGFSNILTQKEIETLFSMGLYVQGIAFSLEKQSEWKLYINVLPRKKA
ncbi:MAG: hypothetical protein ACI4EU_06820 [Butyrivibrio sp.]